MNSYERDEISKLPYKYHPMNAWSYFGYQILFSIPLIGLVILLICAFNDKNINRRNFARSFFCIYIIIIAVIIIIATGGFTAISGIF